jgi:hypothetical protein
MYLPSGAVAGAVVLAVVGAAVVGLAVHQGLAVVGAAVGLPVAAVVGAGVAGLAVVGAAVGFAVKSSNRTHRHESTVSRPLLKAYTNQRAAFLNVSAADVVYILPFYGR